MKLLIVVIIILAIIALAQIMKVYELSSKLRNKNEAEVTPDESRFNAGMLILFMIVFLASSVWLMFNYSSTVVGPSASEHGVDIDWLYNFNWAILLFVFFLTQPILFIFAAKYRAKEGVKATFFSHSNKLELIWTIIPTVVLAAIIIFGLTIWNGITDTKEDSKKIELYAYQFGWIARYAGDDNTLGESDFKVLDEASNPLGVLTKDVIKAKQEAWKVEIASLEEQIADSDFLSDEKLGELESKLARLKRQLKRLEPLAAKQTDADDKAALDDVIVKELVLIKGQNYEFKFRSRDVIHSAFFPHFRAQMNCVPGMVTRFTFKPTITTEEMRKNPAIVKQYKDINKKREEKGEDPIDFNYVLLCNKICGSSHYNMQLNITVVETKAEYERWMNEQKETKSFAALLGLTETKEEIVNTVQDTLNVVPVVANDSATAVVQ